MITNLWKCIYLTYEVLYEALLLDIYDLNYLYVPHNLDYTLMSKIGVPRWGYLIRGLSFLKHLIFSGIAYVKSAQSVTELPSADIVCFCTTNNQQSALTPIANSNPQTTLWGINGYGRQQIPLFPAYCLSLLFVPMLLFQYISASKQERRAYSYVADLFLLSYGYYIWIKILLIWKKPRVVVMANDHLLWTRALMRAARSMSIQTVYIQHASVTERFPPLEFDFALLEGLDALKKYARIGNSNTNVFLIGMPKLDGIVRNRNSNQFANVIGVCTDNKIPFDVFEDTCLQLQAKLFSSSVRFILRIHPGDCRQNQWKSLTKKLGWQLSFGAEESISGFLNKVDVIVAGDSNILLEAALANVYPIYYDFSKTQLDWYGFVQNGLVTRLDSLRRLTEKILVLTKNKPDVWQKTQYYCDTVGTTYDGYSTELSVSLIGQIAANGYVAAEKWRELTEHPSIKAYTLRS